MFSPINLRELLDETLKILRSGGELNGTIALEGNFRDVGASPIFGNAGQFKQVFWNLIKNAIKAMPDGGRPDGSISPSRGRRRSELRRSPTRARG